MAKVITVIQARINSSRLPGKVMLDISGRTLLERVIERTVASLAVDQVWLATSVNRADDILETVGKKNGLEVFRGDSEDVLSRFCRIIDQTGADLAVRVTADDPLIETSFIAQGIKSLLRNNADYLGFRNMPYGSAVEVIKAGALVEAGEKTDDRADKEHVTKYLIEHGEIYRVKFIEPDNPALRRPDIRVTIDTPEDYLKISLAYRELEKPGQKVDLEAVIRYFDQNGIK